MAMTRRSWIAASVVLATGCSTSLQSTPTASVTNQAATSVQASAGPTPAGASLPFKTVAFDDGGSGHIFATGTTETVVLRSKADLDAFVARHKPAVAPVYGPPSTIQSPNPVIFLPPPIPGVSPQPAPTFTPTPVPDTLTGLDFGKYEAIAFFDGAVKVASMSRITAVQDQGSGWKVLTKRWEPPANPDAIPDVNGRLHVIAIPRSDAAVTFAPTEVADGSSTSGVSGYSVGGNPYMSPL